MSPTKEIMEDTERLKAGLDALGKRNAELQHQIEQISARRTELIKKHEELRIKHQELLLRFNVLAAGRTDV